MASVIFFIACSDNESGLNAGKDSSSKIGAVDIYLLKSFSRVENSSAIDETTVVLEDTPLITYDEIVSYSPNEHMFVLKDDASISIPNSISTDKAFAVAIDRKVVYTGYFVSGFSSIVCSWTVIDPLRSSSTNSLIVQMGYPQSDQFAAEFSLIPDRRNSKEILDILRRDGKLIE